MSPLKGIFILFLFISTHFLSQDRIELDDAFSKAKISYTKVNKSADGNVMNDSFLDGVIYIKKNDSYYKRVYDGKINVKWFGAVGDGKQDDSKAIQKAFNIGESIYFPPGQYKFNAVIKKHFEIEGNGGNTYFLPFNLDIPIIKYETKNPYWTYSSSIANVGFKSVNKKGIAISFGENKFENKNTYDEYVGNVTFRNVLFEGFNQAILFPYGNIGSNFYSCSFQQNNYGVYSLDNKMKGDVMHAGNKYFYASEFDSNDVAVYFNNSTEGFGGVSFMDCIFQYNTVNGYFYSNNTFTPVSFQNCWDEQKESRAEKVSIDQYKGNNKTSKYYKPASYIFEGKSSSYIFIGGRLGNINIFGDNIVVNSYSSKFESKKSANSGESLISGQSYLNLFYPTTDQGIQVSDGIQVKGFPLFTETALTVTHYNPEARYFPFDNKNINSSIPEWFSVNFNKPVSLSGAFNPLPPVLEKNNYASSNLIKLNFTKPQTYIAVNESNKKFTKGFYFFTVKMKVNKGKPMVNIWDRNKNQFLRFAPILDGEYHSYGGYGYLTTDADLLLDINSQDNSPVELNLESYKVFRFDSFNAIQKFLTNDIIEK